MSRLASFKGPSTPTPLPVRAKESSAPSSPSRISESTHHRKVRTLLQELRAVAETWEDIVMLEGLKAAKALVDARTDLDNDLSHMRESQPTRHVVGDRLSIMEKSIANLSTVIEKLSKQFQKMNTLIEGLEGVFFETYKFKGWQFVQEPLWVSWSLERFVTTIPNVLTHYHRSLTMHIELVAILQSHDTTFEASREAISQWAAQPHLEENSWDAQWEDLCATEIDRWNSPR